MHRPLPATKGRRFLRARSRGISCLESIRPENTDPIPVRTQPPQMGSIIIRFVGLLLVATVALAIVWLR